MKRHLKVFITLWVFCAALVGLVLAHPAVAADKSSTASSTSQAQPKTGFSVSSVLPDEQTDKGKGYTDLETQPGKTYTIGIRLISTGSEATTITVELNNAYTADSGVIAYDQYNRKLYHPKTKALSDLVQGTRKHKVVLQPGKTKTILYKVKMPSEAYKGMILGAVTASALTKPDATSGQKVTINNRIAYNMGVVLRQNDKTTTPDILVGSKVIPTVIQGHKGVKITMTNAASMYASKMAVHTKIYKGTKRIKQNNQDSLAMAPFSKFNYFIPIKLKSGTYKMKGTITSANGKAVTFTRNFSVTKAETKKPIVQTQPVASKPAKLGWIVLFVALAIILLAVVWIGIYYFAMVSGRKKRAEMKARRQGKAHNRPRSDAASRRSGRK